MKELSIYIHIPFCDHKCIYCDFYSIISYENVSAYLISLKKEIEFYSKLYRNEHEVISIYFGGGTPSFMKSEYIREIISFTHEKFNVKFDAEITLETNPGTVDKEKLKAFREIGINRISIGVQSFNNDELEFLTRIHSSNTAIQTLIDAEKSGFQNISLDLIFNLPNQTKEKWKYNLEKAVSLPVKHISAYSLILERGTILNKMVLDGKVDLRDADYDADLYELTIDFLTEKGFEQYEVSNFSKSGYQCTHNNTYWHYKNYLGFGTSAHSFVNGKRWWNYSGLTFYNESIKIKGHARIGEEILSQKEKTDEFVMLSLRSTGLNLCTLKNDFDSQWLERNEKYFNQLIDDGYLFWTENFIKLTKKGYAVCDEILAKFK